MFRDSARDPCTRQVEERGVVAQTNLRQVERNPERARAARSSSFTGIRRTFADLSAASQVLTHRWSLRETDLWNYSLSLQEIDKMRVDGKFVDADGNRPEGQYVSNACAIVLHAPF